MRQRLLTALLLLAASGRAQTPTDQPPDAAVNQPPPATSGTISGTSILANFDTTAPLLDQTETEKEGAIADVNINKIVERQRDLKPENGFEDIFLMKGGSASLDIQNLPIKKSELCWRQTAIGLIESGTEEKETGSYRIKVGTIEGSTQLLVYNGKGPECRTLGPLVKVYRITVTSQNLVQLLQEMKVLIGHIEGLEMKIVGQQIVVDGQVLVPKEMRRVLAVLGPQIKLGKPILNLVEVSPLSMKLLGEKMAEEIAGGKDRPQSITVKVVNGRFFLNGTVDKRVDRETAMKICEAYFSERYTLEAKDPAGGILQKQDFADLPPCVNMVRIKAGQAKPPDQVIKVRVDFVTVNRSYLKTFDFQWAPGLSMDGDSTYSTDTGKFITTFTGTLANLFPKLQSAKQHGHARILKSLEVMVRDGLGKNNEPPRAKISEKFKINYAVQPALAGSAPTLATVDMTTFISIAALSVPQSNTINLNIEASQTEPISVQNANVPPSSIVNDLVTEINVENGESAALGGIIGERRSIDMGRSPGSVSDITLFDLDKKHAFKDEKSQFIIFVTPQKLRTTAEGTDQLKRKFRLRK
jgi:pilus assembly protein CpaC